MATMTFDDEPPPEPRDGWLLVRVFVPELNVHKCLQFPSDKVVWDVKQQCLASLPKVAYWFWELKESFNYGLFSPPSNGKAGKFLDEERRLGDYPFNGPVGYLELKYKQRVYKMLNLDERQLKALHTRANLRRFIECINSGQVEKIAKMCAKGLDPNFHCQETGETPLTIATGTKKPNKLLIALVNGGALLDYRTRDGATALHRAVERDSLEAVSTLLELGASPNYRDTKGLTPVYLSVTRKTDPKVSEVLLHDHATLGIQDSQGWQEIHQACRNGLVHHLEHLLFYGADMDGQNASGNTPLHVCAVNNQEACARMLLFRGANRGALNYANQTPYQVAVIAGNLELAEMIQNYKSEDIVPFRGPPRYNPRRRSGLGWGSTLSRIYGGPPSPCPSEHPFSSASSSLSEGSSHRSHEDDISIVTDKSLGDTSDIISDSSGVGTNSDSAACSIGHPSTTVVCMEGYDAGLSGHIHIQPGDVIEVVGSTDCGLLEGFVRGTNKTGFFPSSCVQEVQFRQKSIINVSTSTPHHHYLINTSSNEIVSHDLQRQQQQQHQQHQQQQQHQMQQVNHDQQLQQHHLQQQQQQQQQQYSSQTAPRMKKSIIGEPRTVVLHRAKRGFGFILRGAKASSPLMQLKPSPRCPALQYLDDVDPGGVADMSGLKPGDFLLAINNEDVTCASHEHVVDLIRNSGALVSMTVVTLSQNFINSLMLDSSEVASQHSSGSGMSTPISSRQCSTLPRRMNGGPPGKQPAPMPPRRDPKTTLSVGRARAKSMVAGLEGGGEKVGGDDDELLNATKSTSAESIHQAQLLLQAQALSHSAIGTPTQTGPGTPIQPRTASIKSRPTSSRITAAELEELFQRQQGADANRCSMLMTSSRFQSTGLDSGAATPPTSPQKGPIVYASVAEMKRKKSSKVLGTLGGSGTLKGRPIPIPQIGADLRRTFHSTPDLASVGSLPSDADGSSSGTGSQLAMNAAQHQAWYSTVGHRGHRSQDDMHSSSLHMSLQRLNLLPPPNHPPPPPPVGQVVKVAVSRGSEYECLTALRKHIAQKAKVQAQIQEAEVMSSFKPASNAKLYASPQDIRNVGYRTVNVGAPSVVPSLTGNPAGSAGSNDPTTSGISMPPSASVNIELRKTSSLQSTAGSTTSVASGTVPTATQVANVTTVTIGGGTVGTSGPEGSNPYAQPGRPGGPQQIAQPQALYKSGPNSAPPLPEPDYSLSESDPDEDSSVRLVRTLTKTSASELKPVPNPGMAAETSGNSNTSGSSTGSSSMPHSFSVDEIQKIRTKLKSSKSYPNDFLRQQNGQPQHGPGGGDQPAEGAGPSEEGDNSSSGVSSDQEVTVTSNDPAHVVQQEQQSVKALAKSLGAIAGSANLKKAPVAPGVVGPIGGAGELKRVTLQQGVGVKGSETKAGESSPERRSEPEEGDDDGNDSPSPPATGFQRHNSLTRKQAATLAANRAKANQQNLQQRHAVTLATLPPPIEADSDEADSWSHPQQLVGGAASHLADGPGMVVLAPPPEFSDTTTVMAGGGVAGGVSISVSAAHHSHHQHHQHQHVHHHHQHGGAAGGALVIGGHNPNCKRVRIVGAVPKVNRMNSQ
ncbi:SH3 and multiple ankyrin repeat domains protein 1 [Anopheles bellator]|uniref:SH3 and multiple ankyrin repeat domains protein 1 n=1 Tax=Anopheles bellator TaxID=139047 RepID=UPI0026480234|nr:SH3 and multiple ankyrin repeat domains protein 1 [Anopheles bellator]